MLTWEDANGTNAAVFSYDPSGTNALFVDQEAHRPGAAARRLRHVQDALGPCEGDVVVTFVKVPDPLVLTDLDHDGRAELTFGYRLACRTDVSPSTLKVLLLEDGAKFILRGESKVEAGCDEVLGGSFDPDPSLDKAPKEFRAHLERVWAAVVGDSWSREVAAP